MYLDDLIETLTILRENRKLMGSARVFAHGKEIQGIESNGFDLTLIMDEYEFPDGVPEPLSAVDEHVQMMEKIRTDYGTEEETGN